ncbi:hypothetical protein C479_14198 [Halovivax asiaticus JCM 14624]|uniref:Uncharacterized protein n=1 Tax=Halovivax asiaticus JCM 14624 TaxID=1227490 RepID=M0BDF7_9EURY|nr:hypothetical protein [Halovivax asiaticus]ELZ08497.1 hypothetical protein C479_14198 [Halovivax asiaticus JCM 14624]
MSATLGLAIETVISWFVGLGIVKQLIALGTFLVGGYYYGLMLVTGFIGWIVGTIEDIAVRHLLLAAIAVLFGYEWVVGGVTNFV